MITVIVGYFCIVCDIGLVYTVIFTARRSYASAIFEIVILSVRPSVTRALCDETKEHAADILIPPERVIITLVS